MAQTSGLRASGVCAPRLPRQSLVRPPNGPARRIERMARIDRIAVCADRVAVAALARSAVVALSAQRPQRARPELIVVAAVSRMMIGDRRRRHPALLAAERAERLEAQLMMRAPSPGLQAVPGPPMKCLRGSEIARGHGGSSQKYPDRRLPSRLAKVQDASRPPPLARDGGLMSIEAEERSDACRQSYHAEATLGVSMRGKWDRGKARFVEGLSKSCVIAGRFFAFVRRSHAVSWLKSQFPTIPALIPVLLGVILGYGLKTYGETAEAARLQRIEVQRAARSVTFELQNNLDLMGFDLDYLNKDIAASEGNTEVVQSMSMFSTVAGQMAFLRGSFDSVSIELTEQVGTVDTLLDGLNQRIQQRDLYRFTNAQMNSLQIRRKILDQDLTERLETARSAMTRLIEDVRRVRDLGNT
jgi:hypothetical protein